MYIEYKLQLNILKPDPVTVATFNSIRSVVEY